MSSFKKMIFPVLALSLLVPTQGFAQKADPQNELLIVGGNTTSSSIASFEKKSKDENAAYLKGKFKVKNSSKNDIKKSENEKKNVAVSLASLQEDSALVDSINQAIDEGRQVYVYGTEFAESEVEDVLKITITKESTEKPETATPKKWQYIGLKKDPSGVFKYDYGKVGYHVPSTASDQLKTEVDAQDREEKKGPPVKEELIIQSILNEEDRELKKKEKSKEITKDKNKVATLGYGDDPIVLTLADLNAYEYAFSGDEEIAVSLNVDLLLHQNISNDNDSSYDFFYLEDAVELNGFNGYTVGYDLRTWHELPWKSSDNVRDWGPDSNSGSQFTVALPWGVEWQFSSNSSVAITTEGSQTDDKVFWNVDERFYQYGMGLPVRLKPGTAWISSGTNAGINTKHYGSVRKSGGFDLVDVSLDFDLRYDY